jgi:hypothetical protein
MPSPCTGLAIQKTTRSMESSPDNLETFLATQRERHRNIFDDRLVLRWPFDVVDHEHLYRAFARLDFESELIL